MRSNAEVRLSCVCLFLYLMKPCTSVTLLFLFPEQRNKLQSRFLMWNVNCSWMLKTGRGKGISGGPLRVLVVDSMFDDDDAVSGGGGDEGVVTYVLTSVTNTRRGLALSLPPSAWQLSRSNSSVIYNASVLCLSLHESTVFYPALSNPLDPPPPFRMRHHKVFTESSVLVFVFMSSVFV